MKDKLIKLFYLFLPIILGSIVGFIISKYIDYSSLNKPPFCPNKIFFPIAWFIIYILMGISYYLFKKSNNKTLYIYYIQLGFNLLWSIIFFVFKLRLIAVFWIIILDLLVYFMILKFYKFNKLSSILNIPYFIWCLFATYLTIGIYILN